MAASKISLLVSSVLAGAALSQFRAVTEAGAVPAAGARCFGFTETPAASGERVPVGIMGTTIAEAGAAIAANAAVELDASGRVITKSAGVTVGRLMPGSVAAAAGDMVEVMLLPS